MKVTAVIGMNYGDEGKGHITNYLSNEHTLNVRFNGGAQASHAVYLADGRSHIFHHFGSGSLRGARTLLASQFIVNPLIFVSELYELSSKVPLREVFIDPRCIVTTPYDMLINEYTARTKGSNDTVGCGIHETVERSAFSQLAINARDFMEKTDDELVEILTRISKEYLPFRLEALKFDYRDFQAFAIKTINTRAIKEAFLKFRGLMRDKMVVIWSDDNLIDKFVAKDTKNRQVVFEGAQGMLLDQDRSEYFPYLTRSNTGVKNVMEILKTVRQSFDFEAILVTRAYLTRHGDGPMLNDTVPHYANITEPDNDHNPFQGKMRYGYLDRNWYKKAIAETELITQLPVRTAVTCCDHLTGEFKIHDSGSLCNTIITELDNIKLLSSGNTEKDIEMVRP